MENEEIVEKEKGCSNCAYSDFRETDYPCSGCKASVRVGTKEYDSRPHLWAKEKQELVIHPDHYNVEGRKECWDEMIEIFGVEAVGIFDVLSAYKYHYRAGNKDGNPETQDKAKIDNYMRHCADLIAISTIPTTKAKSAYKKMRDILKEEKDND